MERIRNTEQGGCFNFIYQTSFLCSTDSTNSVCRLSVTPPGPYALHTHARWCNVGKWLSNKDLNPSHNYCTSVLIPVIDLKLISSVPRWKGPKVEWFPRGWEGVVKLWLGNTVWRGEFKTKEVYNSWSYLLEFPFISMAVAWLCIYSPGNLIFVLLFQQSSSSRL